jgi:hypothetical protein
VTQTLECHLSTALRKFGESVERERRDSLLRSLFALRKINPAAISLEQIRHAMSCEGYRFASVDSMLKAAQRAEIRKIRGNRAA